MDKNKMLDFLKDTFEVYIELKDNNSETTVSRTLYDTIISCGKYYSVNNENASASKLNELIFMLYFIKTLQTDKKLGNYNVLNIDNVIKKGESLCLDLINKKMM